MTNYTSDICEEAHSAFLELAARRRSVRGYAKRNVERDKIEHCLEAARLAPSACNSQPWLFIVIDDPGLKDEVASATTGGILPLNHFARQAPVMVVVVAEPAKASARMGSVIKNKPFAMMDVAMATEHFCLQAAEEGLGTCILGWFDEFRVRSLLKIPKSSRPVLILTLGYADTAAVSPLRRKSVDEISAWNLYPGAHSGSLKHVFGWRSLLGLAFWLGITYAAAAIGGAATARAGAFYYELIHPIWAPPGWLFGPVWSILYTLMGLAAWRVWLTSDFRSVRGLLGLYLIQLVVNAIWSWLFFVWHMGAASFAWILLLNLLVLSLIRAFNRVSRMAARLLWLYLAWLIFAAMLAHAVWRLNPSLL